MKCDHSIVNVMYTYYTSDGKLCLTTKCVYCGLIKTNRNIQKPPTNL